MPLRSCMWVFLSAVLATSVLRAQSVSARLEGLLRDQTQAVIPGVTITATNESTNISTTAVTNEAGRYVFLSLTPGTYTVSAELPGFKKVVNPGLILQVGDSKNIDM